MLIPAVLCSLPIYVIPIAILGRLSLFKTDYISSKFVGFSNYMKVLKDPGIFINSFMYAALLFAGGLLLAVFLSLVVLNMGRGAQSYLRFITFIPGLTAGVIISTVWRWIFHPRSGLANWVLGLFGAEPVMWMAYRFIAIGAIAFIVIISSQAMQVMILQAVIKGIDTQVYEAAGIDGASWLQIKIKIVLPALMPTIGFLGLLAIIAGFQIWETIMLMSPITSAYNLMYDAYSTAFRLSKYGLGAAKSIILMLIIFIASWAKTRIGSRG